MSNFMLTITDSVSKSAEGPDNFMVTITDSVSKSAEGPIGLFFLL